MNEDVSVLIAIADQAQLVADAQKRYFSSGRDQNQLNQCKALEKELRRLLKHRRENPGAPLPPPPPKQEELF